MAITAPSSLAAFLGIAVFVAWRIYARVRSAIGRQRLSSAVRPWITVCLFPLFAALFLLASIGHPVNALALAAGAALGAVLGTCGLRLTHFEETPAGLFYTPNAYLGIALSLLLLGRVGYRIAQLFFSDTPIVGGHGEFFRSPLTLLFFGTLAGYYVTYALGLLRWRKAVQAAADRSLA